MIKLPSDDQNYIELKLTLGDIDALNKGKPAITRWNGQEFVYVNLMDPECQGPYSNRLEKSSILPDSAVLNAETNEIDVEISSFEANNPYLKAVNFSTNYGNMSSTFSNQRIDERLAKMQIRLLFP